MKRDYGKVLVVMGGWSNEREISLLSGMSVYNSLISSGVNASVLDINKNNLKEIKKISPERVFIVLHGKGGEDGEIQSYLDKLSIPYTGSDSNSSSICMNKRQTKDILLENSIPTPYFCRINNNNIKEIEANFPYPFVIKPSSEGSSIGVHIVEDIEDCKKAVFENTQISNDFIGEQYIKGNEYTVGILNNDALPIIKLEPPGKFYDYDAKYNSEKMKYICPSGLPKEKEEDLKKLSLKTFKTLKCKGWGRVDIILDEKEQKPWIIEINTVPGMTEHSLLPMAAKEKHIDFDSLVLKILDTSYE